MSRMLEIKIDRRAFDRCQKLLKEMPAKMNAVMEKAIRTATRSSKVAISKETRKVYTLSAAKIKRTIVTRVSKSGDSVVGEIKSTGSRIATMHFKHSPNRDTTGSNRKAIRVTVKKGGSSVPWRTGFQSAKKANNIFIRTGKGRELMRAYSLAVPQMLENVQVNESIQDGIREKVTAVLDRETQKVLAKR